MRKSIFIVLAWALVASSGYCQDVKQPLTLTIKSEKQIFSSDKHIILSLTIKNVSSENVEYIGDGACFQTLQKKGDKVQAEFLILEFDGKEYIIVSHGCSWGGPDLILSPGEEKDIVMDIADFGITKHSKLIGVIKDGKVEYQTITNNILTTGKHKMAVKINEAVSNTITIEVVENNGISKKDALKIAEKVCEESGWKWKDAYIFEQDGNG